MNTTKIVLVNPPYVNFEGIKESAGHIEPLNLLYLAAYLRENTDCEISILDAEAEGLSYTGIKNKLKKESPDIVGITFLTPTFKHVTKIAEIAKEVNSGCVVVVGGAHPTAFPEQVVEILDIDFVVIGEGELTLLELVNAVRSEEKSFEHIDGLAYKSGNKIFLTSPRALIRDLDTIPFPARDLIDRRLYYSAPTKKVSSEKNSTLIFTGRGCPYNCIFCMSEVIWQRKVRYRSPKTVVDEIEECVNKYGLREFNFIDDTFILTESRVTKICREIKKRNLDISWICFGRANHVSSGMLRELKKAGCKRISFGLESGSQEILNLMRKNITLEQSRNAVKMAKEEGLEVHASFMLGNIGETEETIKKTIKFAKELVLDYATFFITTPIPGTDLYKIALEKGFISVNPRWEDFAPITKGCPPLVQNNLTKEELLKWQKKAFREYYLRPKVILKKLLKIRSFQDIKSILEGLKIFTGIQKR